MDNLLSPPEPCLSLAAVLHHFVLLVHHLPPSEGHLHQESLPANHSSPPALDPGPLPLRLPHLLLLHHHHPQLPLLHLRPQHNCACKPPLKRLQLCHFFSQEQTKLSNTQIFGK